MEINGQQKRLPIIIAGGNGPPLCGRNWFRAIRLDWNRILSFPEDFKTAQLVKPRPIPYALIGQVKADLLKLEKAGILKRVNHSSWGALIVDVSKTNGSIRVCGDYKITVVFQKTFSLH